MNTTPNPNYPLPEKWYVKRTPKNSIKVNNLCSQILETGLMWGNIPSDHSFPHFTPYIHSVFNASKTKCFTEPQEGYTEVTYEDLWLAYMIPEKWYCIEAPITLLNRWRRLNGVEDLRGTGGYFVLSKHGRDHSYFWGGNLSGLKRTEYYDDYKEISLGNFRTLLNILEQNKNSKPMESNTPTEVIIPITEFAEIVDVACDTWQKKLRSYVAENITEDCRSVKVTKDFYNQMIAASTTRDGINQADVINSVLPMFKHDPYKVFRDAEKEGKIVQYLDALGVWHDPVRKWNYSCNPSKYRIKHKHQDLIDEWEASGKTKTVQYRDFSTKGEWVDLHNKVVTWEEDSEYRFKPELEYVPFAFEDYELFFGKTIKSKDGSRIAMITSVSNNDSSPTQLEHLFDTYTFLDGTPFGKLVQK